MPRSWEPRERRLVAEWVALTFPQAHVIMPARLGAVDHLLEDANLSENLLRALGVFRRWVDALVVEPATVHLVEGKIRNTPGALEQLDLYALLLPLTPEFQYAKGRPVVRHLVRVIEDPLVEAMARERGIRVHTYHPAWVDDYLKLLTPRMRSGPADGELVGDLFPAPEGNRGGVP